jgi:hypothetical protein
MRRVSRALLVVIGGSPMQRIGRRRRRLDPVFPADTDAMIQVSGLALVALMGCCFDLLRISAALPGVAFAAAAEYTAGLVLLARRATAARISRVLGGISHDRLTRLREQDRFSVPSLVLAFIKVVHALGVRGWLCLDDTCIPHERSRKMRGVYWDYDHALGRNVLGTRIVVLLWTDGFWRIPVGFAVWHKRGARPKYRTKNELARTLLRWAIHRGLRPKYVAFDNWYASRENLRLVVEELGCEFVTRLKRNARIVWGGRRLQARTIGRRLLAERSRYGRNGTQARATLVEYAGMAGLTFVVARNDFDGEGSIIRYLLASAPRTSAAGVVERYKSRWIIEIFFEDLKQHLSLGSYQGRTLDGQMCHVALAFAGLVALDAMRKKAGFSFCEAREWACRLAFARTARGECELVSLRPAPHDALDGLDAGKELVAGSLDKVSQLKLPEDIYAREAA